MNDFEDDLTEEEREERERWESRWATLEKFCCRGKHRFLDSDRARCAELRMIDHVASGDMPDYI